MAPLVLNELKFLHLSNSPLKLKKRSKRLRSHAESHAHPSPLASEGFPHPADAGSPHSDSAALSRHEIIYNTVTNKGAFCSELIQKINPD